MRAAKHLHLALAVIFVGVLSLPAVGLAAEATTTTEAAPAATTETTPTTPSAPAISSPPVEPEAAKPQVQSQISQGSGPGSRDASGKVAHKAKKNRASKLELNPGKETSPGRRSGHKASLPTTLTPSLPANLTNSIGGVSSFFVENFQVPPFLLPIYQAAGTAYGIPWQVLAAINEVETDYGRDLSISSAGAEGWMQFLPSSWEQYGVDANGDGYKDPYNPADAIFAAARYLRAAGGNVDLKASIYSYNHSQAYVESVMLRARLLAGTPAELLGAVTGLTEAHFPVHAAAHFSDGFPSAPASGSGPASLVGTVIEAQPGAPVVAVQDGEITQIGRSKALGHFLRLRDAFGNTYTYAQLGDIASVYPVLEPHLQSTVSTRISQPPASEPPPSGPATAGAQPRSPMSEGAAVSGLALGAAASLETAPAAATPPASPSASPPAPASVKVFREGTNDVYLHALRAHVQVIAGTVLGHIAASRGGAPHVLFQIRPAGTGAPLIDPKPILDGWVALENSSIFRAKGENPFLATSPSTGQVLLESKRQLIPQVLHDHGVRLTRCGRDDVQAGRVDKRVLAMLEYLSVSGLRPTVVGLPCGGATAAALATNTLASTTSEAVAISAINGVRVAGNQRAGTVVDTAVHKLLMLQGLSRPHRIASMLSYPGASSAVVDPSARGAIRVSFSAPRAAIAARAGIEGGLTPEQWIKLTARLGEIPDPTVSRAPSAAAIRVPSEPQGATGGHH